MRDALEGSGYLHGDLSKTVERLRSLADDLEAISKGSFPDVPTVSVSQWLLAKRAVPCLVGKVRGHPVVKGKYVATTEVFFLNQSAGLARTLNRWYRLGSAGVDNGDFR